MRIGMSRPKLSFYHADEKCEGSAVTFQLYPAHDDDKGCIQVEFAKQLTAGRKDGPYPTYPIFDWENRITFELGFEDVSKCLLVLIGESESTKRDEGIVIENGGKYEVEFCHVMWPKEGYGFGVRYTPRKGEEQKAKILFNEYERAGLREAFASSLMYIGLGVPKVYEQHR